MATIVLYKDKRPWVNVPEWLDGDLKILWTIRQIITQRDEDEMGVTMVEAMHALDEYLQRQIDGIG